MSRMDIHRCDACGKSEETRMNTTDFCAKLPPGWHHMWASYGEKVGVEMDACSVRCMAEVLRKGARIIDDMLAGANTEEVKVLEASDGRGLAMRTRR